MESIMGGELHTYIYEQQDYKLREEHAKFYVAQLVKELCKGSREVAVR